jgi:large subunit ribosomal protein L29
MASKKYLELQSFSDAELMNELKETQTQYQLQKFDHAVKGLENPVELKEIRRDVARLKTEIRKRELANFSEEATAGRSKIRARRRNK